MAIPGSTHQRSDLEREVQAFLVRFVRRVGIWVAVGGILVFVLLANPPLPTSGAGGQASAGGLTAQSGSPGGSAGPGLGSTGAPRVSTSPGGTSPTLSGPSSSTGGSTRHDNTGRRSGGRGALGGISPSGTSRAGVRCAPGVRQLPGSAYGAACRPAFTGTNGGATTSGVTKSTITITLRIGTSGQSAAVYATGGTALDSVGGKQQAVAADFRTLTSYFNKVFELYGRHVVLKTYTGQGDVLAEDQGQGVAGAQADAARAKDLGAFADVSIFSMSQPYAEALAANKIEVMSPLYLSQNWYADHAPYAVGVVSQQGTVFGQFVGNVVCRRLAGQPAALAGPGSTGRRVFGILYPDNPEFQLIGDRISAAMALCGAKAARRVTYALNLATLQQEATNAIAQMKAAGVTTILCACDQFSPIFLTRAADSQHYYPEWMDLGWPDPWGRLAAADQWGHALFAQGTTPNYATDEVGRVFRVASKGAAPQSPQTLHYVYEQLLALFSAIEDAGPDLTPQSFQQGFSAIPSTANGALGPWTFGPGVLNPDLSFQLGQWEGQKRSKLDGQLGSIQSCASGAWFRYDDPAALGPQRTALGCRR